MNSTQIFERSHRCFVENELYKSQERPGWRLICSSPGERLTMAQTRDVEIERVEQNQNVLDVVLIGLADYLHGGVRGREKSNITSEMRMSGGGADLERELGFCFCSHVPLF